MALNSKPMVTPTKPKTTCNAHTTDAPPAADKNSNTPTSPRRLSHCRRKLRRRGSFLAGLFRGRRNILRYFLLFPLLYISGLITCVGPISAILRPPPLPGSVYKSHQIFDKLWEQIQSDNSSVFEVYLTIFFYLL